MSNVGVTCDEKTPVICDRGPGTSGGNEKTDMKDSSKSSKSRKTGEKDNNQAKKGNRKVNEDVTELNEILTLAKSYISKLERRVIELENANKIRKTDLNTQQPSEHNNETSGNINIKQTPDFQIKADIQIHALRNHMRTLEMEQLKMRMSVLECTGM